MPIVITKVSANNTNKEVSKTVDDSMVCDDDNWIDYDDDASDGDDSEGEKNQSVPAVFKSVAVTKIPPKDVTPYSDASESPKSKKRKFPDFDELLQNLDYNILHMNFTKLLLFLESNNIELTFPFSSIEYDLLFEMVVQDISILKSTSLDTYYRDICDKIIKAASISAANSLAYAYEFKEGFDKVIMVIKKVHFVMDNTGKEMPSSSCSTEGAKPSQTSGEGNSNEALSRSPSPAISSSFKKHCLQTTLAFVKSDVTKTKEFPNLSLEKAHFLHLLLESVVVLTFTEFDSDKETIYLYRALWEAIRIHSLKYEFRVRVVESWVGNETKNLVFEKIPLRKSGGTSINSELGPAENSNHLVNPTADVLKTKIPKPEITKQTKKTEAPKPEAPKPEAPKPGAPKPNIANLLPPVPYLMPILNQKKRPKKKQRKIDIEIKFIQGLPSKFVSNTLNSILDFLLDDEKNKMVLVPKSPRELDFYRRCIDWCRAGQTVSRFGPEFHELLCQIALLLSRFKFSVPKGSANKINEVTGLKEVTYLKALKHVNSGLPESVQSAPKKKKVNVQNVLELAATENIQLTQVINLNKSLRNKKKNKKIKKAEKANDARVVNEINKTSNDALRETLRLRRDAMERKEKLKEALSVPVQSDKAMKMMLGMGWSGGALGARGNGITEPLMPSLDLARGAGLGHSRNSQPETIARKPNETKSAPSWVSENPNPTTQTDKSSNDVQVQKTKQIIKAVDLPKPTESKVELFTSTKSTVELSKPTTSNVKLPSQTKTFSTQITSSAALSKSKSSDVELPKPTKSNVELPKPTTSNAKIPKEKKTLPTQTKFSIERQKPGNSNLEFPLPFRQEILHSVLGLLNSDSACKTLIYNKNIPKKGRRFVVRAVEALKSTRSNHGIFLSEEQDICKKIQDKYKQMPELVVKAVISWDFRSIELKKMPSDYEPPLEQDILTLSFKASTEVITEKDIKSYINTTGSQYGSQKAYEVLKFRVLFLLNILNFMKSPDEEVEVFFNKVVALKQKTYIVNVVDEINMRIKFGSSPAEARLCAEIKKYAKDAFLGAMFNHQYTAVTLSKYYRFKRLNRPDNAVKRKSKTSVNLDDFSSATYSESRSNTDKSFNKETNNKVSENNNKVSEHSNKVTEHVFAENDNTNSTDEDDVESLPDEIDVDSDSSSIEEYNNNNSTTKVPQLQPGKKGVNISNFLFLYDKENTKSTDIKNISNNDSASNSNATEKRNNKNNIGNGNVVIDNNDNQVIDMKRDDSNTKNHKRMDIGDEETTEYVVCVDYTEEVVDSTEMTADINKKNVKDEERNYEPIRYSDKIVVNVEVANVHEEIGIDNYYYTKNKLQDNLNVHENPPKIDNHVKEDTDVTMKKINSEAMKIISPEQSTGGIDKKESIKVNSKQELMAEIKKDVLITETNKVGSMTAINKKESMAVIDKDESMAVINKDVIDKGEFMAEINDESKAIINKDELVEATTKTKSSKDIEVAQIKQNSINPCDEHVKEGDSNVVIKTDCDKLTKDNIVLGKDICDTHTVELSQVKSVGTETDVPNYFDNKYSEIKNVRITHTLHPIRKLTNEKIIEIQKLISKSITPQQLPLLKCHGVQKGALIYTCHNKNTYDWLQNTISVASYAKVSNTRDVTRMTLKFCCFFDFDSKYLFELIELYNQDISTKDWVVEKAEKHVDYVIFVVRMDTFSINYVQASGLALFAGVDKVEFSIIWD